MIRIAVMMDKNRIIGSSTEEGNLKRFKLLPRQLPQAMGQLYQGENIAGGESSWNMPTKAARNNRYVITRNESFDVGKENVQIVKDVTLLINQYEHSEEELLIVGGLSMFNLFTPVANQIDIAESFELVPGDLVYDIWEKESFELIKEKKWEGFRVLTYKKKKID